MVDKDTVQSVAYDLLGSCDDLDHVLEGHGLEFDQLNLKELKVIDEITICCDCCGWWVDPSELNDENFCRGCEEE